MVSQNEFSQRFQFQPVMRAMSLGLLVFAGACQAPATVSTDDAWTEGRGEATTRAEARERALEDAVSQKTGEVVSSMHGSRNGQLTYSEVKTFLRGAVAESRIKSETKDTAGNYVVVVQARVVEQSVREAVQWIVRNVGRPRLLVIASENHLGRAVGGPEQFSRETIVRTFAERGFPSVKDEAALKDVQNAEARLVEYVSQGRYKGAAEFAFKREADVLIYVKAECVGIAMNSPSGSQPALTSFQARVSLTAINIHTADVLAQSSDIGTQPEINADAGCSIALKSAAGRALADTKSGKPGLMTQMLGRWAEGSEIAITVSGLERPDVMRLVGAIREDRSVKSADIAHSQGATASLSVVYSGTPTSFVQRVMESLSDSFVLENSVIEPGSMAFRIRRK